MIDLKQKIENIIESEYEMNKISLLEHDWSDSIFYHQNDIVEEFQEFIGRKLNIHELEKVTDYLIFNQDELLDYQECGFPYQVQGVYAIAGNIGEHEIELSCYFPNMKNSVKTAINDNTNLFIPDNLEYGYISCGYDYLSIRNDNDTLIAALIEEF